MLCLLKVLSLPWVCVYVHTSLKSAHKQDKGLWTLISTLQCLWSALGRMLLCCAVSPLVPCGASLHALISDLEAVYMPEAVRLQSELSFHAACAFLAFPSTTKSRSSANSDGKTEDWPVSHLKLWVKDCSADDEEHHSHARKLEMVLDGNLSSLVSILALTSS